MPPERTRVLIVDDEPLVRSGIRGYLDDLGGAEVVGEAGDGIAALAAIEATRPALVFLDVQMPGLDGFEVLDQLGAEERPAVVFVTAFEQYALRAFDAHAIDYLLKPFDRIRFAAALHRAQAWLAGGAAAAPVVALLDEVRQARVRQRFVVRHAGRWRVVPVGDVDWIEARGNYVHLHGAGGEFLLRETLSTLERTLPVDAFVRVHRSAIVRCAAVTAIERTPAGDFRLALASGAEVALSRSHKRAFDRAMRGHGR